jgi:hypothetical protein
MVKTSKKINLAQLNQELGGFGLSADFNNPNEKVIVIVEGSPITDEELARAIDDHIAQPQAEQINLINRQQGIAKLKELGFSDDQITALIS